MPTFCRLTLLKICPGSPAFDAADPTKGTFCPTTMVASMLSAVNSVGADNTLEWVSASSAVTNATSHGTGIVVPVVAPATAAAVEGIMQVLPEARPSPSPVSPNG